MADYDLNLLVEKLKDGGLDVVEEGARHAVEAVLSWVEESAAKSDNKVDDFIVGVMGGAKPLLLDLIDKIDGEEG